MGILIAMFTPVRVHLLTSIGLFTTAIGAQAQGEAHPKPIFAIWAESAKVPALCVGRPHWFVTLVPNEIELDEVDTISLKSGEAEADGKVIYLDESRRLCVLAVAEGHLRANPVPLTSNPFPRAGMKLTCLYSNNTCRSLVAGKDFYYRGEAFTIPFLRVRITEAEKVCRIGMPLLSEKGKIVGLVSDLDLELDNEAHAIPAAQIRKVILDLESIKKSAPSWVGLSFHDQSSTPVIIEVKPDSPAKEAGFETGDVIISLNGSEIEELIDLCDAPFNLPVGVPAKVVILRGLEEVTIKVTPSFLQASATP